MECGEEERDDGLRGQGQTREEGLPSVQSVALETSVDAASHNMIQDPETETAGQSSTGLNEFQKKSLINRNQAMDLPTPKPAAMKKLSFLRRAHSAAAK